MASRRAQPWPDQTVPFLHPELRGVHPDFVVPRGADCSHVGVLAPRYHKRAMRTLRATAVASPNPVCYNASQVLRSPTPVIALRPTFDFIASGVLPE
jgi:hypothetical protein